MVYLKCEPPHIGDPVVRTYHSILAALWCGQKDGRSRDYYVTTTISWLDRLPNLLSNGAPLNVLGAHQP